MAVQPLSRPPRAGSSSPDTEAQAAPLDAAQAADEPNPWGHRWLEGQAADCSPCWRSSRCSIGGLIEIIPMFLIKENVPTIASVKPYTPLEVLGRDIYIREGCVGCHSQMIRPFRSETERYGEYSKAGEFVYDHPFLWGSKRTGPDLAPRSAANIPTPGITTTWTIPRSTSPGSIMPRYPWLLTQKLDTDVAAGAHAGALRKVGVPYPAGYENRPGAKASAGAGAKGRRQPENRVDYQCAGRPRNHRRDRLSAAAGHGHQSRARRPNQRR